MTTSTSKGPLSLYPTSEELEGPIAEYKRSQQELKAALDARQNRLFDPVLLAMAQGFLAPTKTGKFGEALSNVAGLVGPAQAAEEKRNLETAQMRAELAAMELGQVRKTEDQRRLYEMFGLPSGAAKPAASGVAQEAQPQQSEAQPAKPAVAASQPSSAASPPPGVEPAPKPPAGQEPEVKKLTDNQLRILSLSDDAALQRLAKLEMDFRKQQQDRFQISMNGVVFDREKREYVDTPVPGQTPSKFTTKYGEFNMLPWQYAAFLNAEKEGKGFDWMKDFTGRQDLKPTGMRSTEEQKVAETQKTETAKARATGENERYQEIVNKGSNAGTRLATLESLRSIASRNDAKQIFGVFEGSGVADALFKLLETSGKGLPQVNEIRDVFTNLGLDKQLKADQLYAAQQIALINLELRKMTRTPGEGAMSDFEGRQILASGLDRSDTPEAMLKKIAFLKARAEYDREMSRGLRNSKMDVDDFKDSNDGQRIANAYMNKILAITGAAPRTPAATPNQQRFSPAREALRQQIGR